MYVYICIFTEDDAKLEVDLIFCICVWRKTWRGKTINPLFFKLHPDISFSEPLHSKYKIHFKEIKNTEFNNFTTCHSCFGCLWKFQDFHWKMNSTLFSSSKQDRMVLKRKIILIQFLSRRNMLEALATSKNLEI